MTHASDRDGVRYFEAARAHVGAACAENISKIFRHIQRFAVVHAHAHQDLRGRISVMWPEAVLIFRQESYRGTAVLRGDIRGAVNYNQAVHLEQESNKYSV